MAMYSFVLPFREAKFCGVPSCVFHKLGCAAGEKSLRNTALQHAIQETHCTMISPNFGHLRHTRASKLMCIDCPRQKKNLLFEDDSLLGYCAL
jgi:hypothetical protein